MQALHVLGKPVSHSRSPIFHNAALRAAGLPEVYSALEVSPEELADVAARVRSERVLGANITLPYKELAASLADRVTPAVEATGVANTWWSEGGVLWADNTDIHGLQMSFAALLGARLARRVVVLGAGGAAQAAIFALAPVVEELSLVNRTLSKAEDALSRASSWMGEGVRLEALAWTSAGDASARVVNERLASADLVIQASSIPVLSPGDEAPFSSLALERVGEGGGALLELCYASEPTVPMRRAALGGARVLDGATMLLHQGARSFERWVGARPDVVVMRDALADALGRPRGEIVAEIPEEVRALWGAAPPREARCNLV